MRKRKYISKKERWVSNGYGGKVKKIYYRNIFSDCLLLSAVISMV